MNVGGSYTRETYSEAAKSDADLPSLTENPKPTVNSLESNIGELVNSSDSETERQQLTPYRFIAGLEHEKQRPFDLKPLQNAGNGDAGTSKLAEKRKFQTLQLSTGKSLENTVVPLTASATSKTSLGDSADESNYTGSMLGTQRALKTVNLVKDLKIPASILLKRASGLLRPLERDGSKRSVPSESATQENWLEFRASPTSCVPFRFTSEQLSNDSMSSVGGSICQPSNPQSVATPITGQTERTSLPAPKLQSLAKPACTSANESNQQGTQIWVKDDDSTSSSGESSNQVSPVEHCP